MSGNPAAVLLTRISRDERFVKAKGRGVYRLAVGGNDAPQKPRRRRRRKARRRPKTPRPPEHSQ